LLPDTDGIAGCPIKKTKRKYKKTDTELNTRKKKTHAQRRKNKFQKKNGGGFVHLFAIDVMAKRKVHVGFLLKL
jgi:hypothetical protein